MEVITLDNDTIVAISTPLGEGGIGIVRLSGPEAFSAVQRVFKCAKCSEPGFPQPKYLYYGTINNLEGDAVDEALVSFMPAPYTYTREDLVEVNCHSGLINLKTVLKIFLATGVRLAEPGEFTKRAFLNGRIDLSQAEAVIGLIRARSEEATRASLRVLRGKLAGEVNSARDMILSLRAPIEASIDYPEEFLEEPPTIQDVEKKLTSIISLLKDLLKGVERSRACQEGVPVVIIGKPNVGKSSLLNKLLGEQKAIVHELPGTTRDMLEGYLNLGGYPLCLMDTAGIQGTVDPVEREGIERARAATEGARLILLVIDGSEKLDHELFNLVPGLSEEQRMLVILNKEDLPQQTNVEEIDRYLCGQKVVVLSALEGTGIDQLEQAVAAELDQLFGPAGESPILISVRQEEILNAAISNIEDALVSLQTGPVEITSLHLQLAWQKLGEITGDTVSDDLLDRVFKEFCLGK
jgi:tRNA modification GTPase